MPDRLLLVRHGESTWNAEERLQGQLDPPLSDHGPRAGRRARARGRPARAARRSGSSARISRAPARPPSCSALRPGPLRARAGARSTSASGAAGPAAEVDAETDELTNWRGGPRHGARRRAVGRVRGARERRRRRARRRGRLLARGLPRRLHPRRDGARHRRRPRCGSARRRTRASRPSSSAIPAGCSPTAGWRATARSPATTELSSRFAQVPTERSVGAHVPSLGFVRDIRSEAGRPAQWGRRADRHSDQSARPWR